MVYGKMFSFIILTLNFYYHCLADVMLDCVIGRCFLPGRCSLPFVMWQMLLPRGRCYPLMFLIGRCYCHTFCGRCYITLYYVATH